MNSRCAFPRCVMHEMALLQAIWEIGPGSELTTCCQDGDITQKGYERVFHDI